MTLKAKIGDWVRIVAGRTLMERSIDRSLLPLIQRQLDRLGAESKVLDVGSSRGPYRQMFGEHSYETLDIRPNVGADHVGDLHRLSEFVPENAYDLVLCTEVLEHAKHPQRAVEEMRKVLRPGGVLLASSPLIVSYHPDPNDFWRMTREGWEVLLQQFSEADVVPHGNQPLAVWYLAGHGWGMPLRLFDPVIDLLFRFVTSKRVFLGYVAVARK